MKIHEHKISSRYQSGNSRADTAKPFLAVYKNVPPSHGLLGHWIQSHYMAENVAWIILIGPVLIVSFCSLHSFPPRLLSGCIFIIFTNWLFASIIFFSFEVDLHIIISSRSFRSTALLLKWGKAQCAIREQTPRQSNTRTLAGCVLWKEIIVTPDINYFKDWMNESFNWQVCLT